MDLRLHLAIISRFRYVVIGGLVVAIVLVVLSLVRIDTKNGSLSWRESETWRSTETMLLTRTGTPFGAVPLDPASANALSLSNLPVFYSQLANSDAVRALVLKDGPLPGKYLAYQVLNSASGSTVPLPFLSIDGYAATQGAAVEIANRVSTAFQRYVRADQIQSNTPASERVLLQVTSAANKATLAKGRGLTVPIVLFLGVMAATLALVYILENLGTRTVEPVALSSGEANVADSSIASESSRQAARLRGRLG